MSAGGHSVDFVRKGLIVGALFGGLLLLYRYAVPAESPDPTALLALGFVVLAAYTIGELVGVVKLPHITGYLLAGLALGPSVAHTLHGQLPPPFDVGVLNESIIGQLELLNTLALPLICLSAGGALDIAEVRKALRPILGILTGQTIAIFVGCIGLFYLISGPLPFLRMEAIAGLPLEAIVALGAVVGSVSLATSDAATIAIVVSTRARGPLTTNALSVAVLKDILVVITFSAATTLAVGALGAGEAASFTDSLIGIGLSVVMGVGLGAGIHLYLKYINAEVLLFLVALIYTMSFVADRLGAESALMFIAAGFIAANYSEHGDRLIAEVERLSMPVFVVFFTIAGAKLHLDVLMSMAGFAMALVLTRTAALYIGCRVGGTLSGADPASVKYGWMAFVSQAGLAITLADKLGPTYGPEIGGAMFSFILAGVAIHELIGPALLQTALGKAGEIPDAEEDHSAPDVAASLQPEAPLRPSAWRPPEAIDDPWGAPLDLDAPAIRRCVSHIEGQLRDRVAALCDGPLQAQQSSAEQHLRDIEKIFLTAHRQVVVQTRGAVDPQAAARQGLAELARRWRALVAARAVGLRSLRWDPMALVRELDALAEGCPALLHAPLEPDTLAPRKEGRLKAARRHLLRARHRVRSVKRAIALQELCRYHLSGLTPLRLEPIAAAALHGELLLTASLESLLDGIIDATLQAVDRAAQQPSALWAVRRELSAGLAEIAAAYAARIEGGRVAAVLAFSEGVRGIKADLTIIGTLDLPSRSRRFGRVFQERTLGLRVLTDGLQQAHRALHARHEALEMSLELAGVQLDAHALARQHGAQVEARIAEEGHQPLAAVVDGLQQSQESCAGLLEDTARSGAALAAALQQACAALLAQLQDAARVTEQLRRELQDGAAVAPLQEALLSLCRRISVQYTVPDGPIDTTDGSRLFSVTEITVPLRKLMVTAVETELSQQLQQAMSRLAERHTPAVQLLKELEGAVPFSIELAAAELEAHADAALPAEARQVASELLLGALGRGRTRLSRLRESTEGQAEQASEAIEATVVSQLDALLAPTRSGQRRALRKLLHREEAVRRRLVQRAEAWGDLATEARQQLASVSRRALGEDRLDNLRHLLGLSLPTRQPLRQALAAPASIAPLVYRRLFTDEALDQLTGRRDELAEAREALQTGAVAIIGRHGAGVRPVAVAAARGQGGLRRCTLSAPATVADIARWFPAEPGSVVLVEGLEWMFSLRPGGAAPLHRFLSGVLDALARPPDQRSRWVLCAEQAIWNTAILQAPLQEVFSDAIVLAPMSTAQLQTTILSRHAVSGYALHFETVEDIGWQLRYLLLRDSDAARRTRDAWFSTLQHASGGVLDEALRLWLAALRRVDEEAGVIDVGPVPRPPLGSLERLSDETLLTVQQVIRQGWMDAALLAALFSISLDEARARLRRLTSQGLLEDTGERHRVRAHLRGPLCRVLEERRWL